MYKSSLPLFFILSVLWIFTPISFAASSPSTAKCHGKMINPVSHVCWKCMFPLTIGSNTLFRSDDDSSTPPSKGKVICTCPAPPPVYKRVGITLGYYEPFRAADVTRTPYCMVNLGGKTMDLGMKTPDGTVTDKRGGKTGQKESFYHVHWYVYPLMIWMNLVTDLVCVSNEGFDIAYLTELDPMWDDDELAFWLNPEALLFANVIAEAACIADCAASSFNYPLDPLFWCQGCRGGVYPLTGHITFHNGGVDASTAVLEKMIFKLHRELLLHGTMGEKGSCGLYPMPWWKKSQYKLQMTYPKVSKGSKFSCNPVGRTSVIWATNKEFPIKGEDFGYLIWRRRDCCAL